MDASSDRFTNACVPKGKKFLGLGITLPDNDTSLKGFKLAVGPNGSVLDSASKSKKNPISLRDMADGLGEYSDMTGTCQGFSFHDQRAIMCSPSAFFKAATDGIPQVSASF
jgi:hypothetical protein